jgi:mRNA interferase MazF
MDDYSVMLLKNDFEDGGLKLDSVIRPNRLFTSDCSILFYAVGIVNKKKMEEVQNVLKNIFLF